MSKVLARNVYVQVDGDYVAGQTDCSLNLTTTFASSQTKADEGPVDTPEFIDWEVSVSGEVGREDDGGMTIADMKAYSTAGTKVPVTFVMGDMGAYSGLAILSSFQLTGPTEGSTTYSATFKGVGAIVSGYDAQAVEMINE